MALLVRLYSTRLKIPQQIRLRVYLCMLVLDVLIARKTSEFAMCKHRPLI